MPSSWRVFLLVLSSSSPSFNWPVMQPLSSTIYFYSSSSPGLTRIIVHLEAVVTSVIRFIEMVWTWCWKVLSPMLLETSKYIPWNPESCFLSESSGETMLISWRLGSNYLKTIFRGFKSGTNSFLYRSWRQKNMISGPSWPKLYVILLQHCWLTNFIVGSEVWVSMTWERSDRGAYSSQS